MNRVSTRYRFERSYIMRQSFHFIVLILSLVVSVVRASDTALPITVMWTLVEVLDERTVKLRSEKGETRMITLACIGKPEDNRAAITYIKRRLHDQKLTFWPLETEETNWHKRPMCLILDQDLPNAEGHGSDSVYDFPLLNEELLIWRHAPFADIKTVRDPHGLKARLIKAKLEAEARRKEQQERWKDAEERLKKAVK
jgi:hypothetical protein